VSYLFRELRNKSWWDKREDELPWLQQGELVADVFKGLGTEDGKLSTYLIEADKSNVDRVVAAYACTRNSLQRVDYVLIPLDTVAGAFGLNHIAGNTADDEVNLWHRDVIELTPEKLLNLAYLIDNHRNMMTRVREKKVRQEVKERLDCGDIDCDRIDPILKKKLCDQKS